MKNRVILKVLIIIILTLILMLFMLICNVRPLLGSNSLFMPSSKKIENILKQDKNAFILAKEYFLDIQHEARWESISPDVVTYYCENTNGGIEKIDTTIESYDLLQSMQILKDNNVEVISKHNNYVEFSLWSSLDSSCGLIYCGSEPIIDEDGQTKLTELSLAHWYYYKHFAD